MVIVHSYVTLPEGNSSILRIFGQAHAVCFRLVRILQAPSWQTDDDRMIQWIGLRKNLQETIDFPITYGAFL